MLIYVSDYIISRLPSGNLLLEGQLQVRLLSYRYECPHIYMLLLYMYNLSLTGTAGNMTRATSPFSCVPCPSKTFARSQGSSTCEDCPIGSISSKKKGSGNCTVCGSRLRVDAISGSQCVESLEGTFYISSSHLSSGALTLPPSSASSSGAQSIQLACDKGSTSPNLLVEVTNFTVISDMCERNVNNNASSTIRLSSSLPSGVLVDSCGRLSSLLVCVLYIFIFECL